jgi:hypothetical protein
MQGMALHHPSLGHSLTVAAQKYLGRPSDPAVNPLGAGLDIKRAVVHRQNVAAAGSRELPRFGGLEADEGANPLLRAQDNRGKLKIRARKNAMYWF